MKERQSSTEPFNWTRTELVQFLMDEGLRGPRSVLRQKPMEWLTKEAITEGARNYTCFQCGKYSKVIFETGLCEPCETKSEEERDEAHDELSCECPCHEVAR